MNNTDKTDPCPFCGKEAKVQKERFMNPNRGYGDAEYMKCKCKSCGAESKKVNLKFFCDFSDYTVQDFRENPSLRVREDERYEEYVNSVEKEAISHWNTRANESEIAELTKQRDELKVEVKEFRQSQLKKDGFPTFYVNPKNKYLNRCTHRMSDDDWPIWCGDEAYDYLTDAVDALSTQEANK